MSCDDVGKFIRVLVVVDGDEFTSDEYGQVEADTRVLDLAKDFTKGGTIAFKGKDGNQNAWSFDIGTSVYSAKSKTISKTGSTKTLSAKAVPNSDRKMEILFGDAQKIVVSVSVRSRDLESYEARDLCLFAIQLLKQRGSPRK